MMINSNNKHFVSTYYEQDTVLSILHDYFIIIKKFYKLNTVLIIPNRRLGGGSHVGRS